MIGRASGRKILGDLVGHEGPIKIKSSQRVGHHLRPLGRRKAAVDDDAAVAEIVMRGAQRGPYRGFPATGEIHELAIVGHFEVNADGLITRETAYYDQMAAAVALGALPDLQSTRGRLWLLCARPQLLVRRLQARLQSSQSRRGR